MDTCYTQGCREKRVWTACRFGLRCCKVGRYGEMWQMHGQRTLFEAERNAFHYLRALKIYHITGDWSNCRIYLFLILHFSFGGRVYQLIRVGSCRLYACSRSVQMRPISLPLRLIMGHWLLLKELYTETIIQEMIRGKRWGVSRQLWH